MRTRAQRRKNNIKKAMRRRRICEQVYDTSVYSNLHQYSKNKIHSSVPACRGVSKWHLHPDEAKVNSMEKQMAEVL